MWNPLRLRSWIARREENTAKVSVPEELPTDRERRQALVSAREVAVVLGDRLPAEVEGWPAERDVPATVSVLCRHQTDAKYLLALKERGFQLFDAFAPRDTLLFLDKGGSQGLPDYQCYRLPGWEGVPGGNSLAYQFLWQRAGSYGVLEGKAYESVPEHRLFKLRVYDSYWTWVSVPSRDPMPADGSRVRVLGLSSWIGGVSTAFLHGLLVEIMAAGDLSKGASGDPMICERREGVRDEDSER